MKKFIAAIAAAYVAGWLALLWSEGFPTIGIAVSLYVVASCTIFWLVGPKAVAYLEKRGLR